MSRFLSTLVAAVSLAACAKNPIQWGPDPTPAAASAHVTAQTGSAFRLAPGEFAAVGGGEILVGFRGIRSDSRCPVDVQCVWQGDAEAVIGTTTEGREWSWTILHTGVDPQTLHSNGLVIRLLAVEPNARSTVSIEQEDYRAVLEVVREWCALAAALRARFSSG